MCWSTHNLHIRCSSPNDKVDTKKCSQFKMFKNNMSSLWQNNLTHWFYLSVLRASGSWRHRSSINWSKRCILSATNQRMRAFLVQSQSGSGLAVINCCLSLNKFRHDTSTSVRHREIERERAGHRRVRKTTRDEKTTLTNRSLERERQRPWKQKIYINNIYIYVYDALLELNWPLYCYVFKISTKIF